MYERFTDRARKVMQLANQEAQRFNHEYIGTEHILLGLVREGSGVAANVLKNLDIDLRKIRLEVEKIVCSGPERVIFGKLPQTPKAKKVIGYSIEEARKLNHNYVGTEHLLLGLIREQEGVAAQVLMNLGLSLDDVQAEVCNILGHRLKEEPGPQSATDSEARKEGKLHQLDRPLFPPAGAAPAGNQASPSPELHQLHDRIRSLERQLTTVRFLFATLLGAAAGGGLAGPTGALLGLLLGSVLAFLGRFIPAATAGAVAGGFLGFAQVGEGGGGIAGGLLGILIAVCIMEIGRRRE